MEIRARSSGDGIKTDIYLVDDPGPLSPRKRGTDPASPEIPPRLTVQELSRLGGAPMNLVDIVITDDLEKRYRFFAAVTGRPPKTTEKTAPPTVVRPEIRHGRE